MHMHVWSVPCMHWSILAAAPLWEVGVISIRCWGSSVENHKTHAVDPPHHTVLYCATDCQLGAAGWPYGPCDRAGRPSRPPLHGYGWRSGPAARKGPCIMVHCTVKKNPTLYSLLADRRGERDVINSSWLMRIIRALTMMALWRGTNPHAPPYMLGIIARQCAPLGRRRLVHGLDCWSDRA
jgi:hypothetical protein